MQTHGYTLDIAPDGLNGGPPALKQLYVNLNRSQLVTRDWENTYFVLGDKVFGHMIKEFIIFLKTRDHSLVQISGTNVFNFLSDRVASRPKAGDEELPVLGAQATGVDGEAQVTEK